MVVRWRRCGRATSDGGTSDERRATGARARATGARARGHERRATGARATNGAARATSDERAAGRSNDDHCSKRAGFASVRAGTVFSAGIGQLPCPTNPPAPVGWSYWKGKVSPALSAFAIEVECHPAIFAMGSFVQALIEEQFVGARVEWHDFKARPECAVAFAARACSTPRSLVERGSSFIRGSARSARREQRGFTTDRDQLCAR